jgi:hypothetical protein
MKAEFSKIERFRNAILNGALLQLEATPSLLYSCTPIL